MMESGHFYLVITDVDGRITKFNRNFQKICADPIDDQFEKFLSPNSEAEFSYSLELMLGAPKIRRHLMLEHPVAPNGGFSQIWWEFSVITTSEMDISGIIGIGVGMHFLEQEMPWNNLVDVLGFGKLALDSEFKVRSWDDRILQWFDPVLEQWEGKDLMEISSFFGVDELQSELESFYKDIKPSCFLIRTNDSERKSFAALLTGSTEGFHLFLVPKESQKLPQTERKLLPQQLLDTLPGAVFLLSESGKLIQQNLGAKELSRVWRGRSFSEGYALSFPNQPNRFSKLIRAIEDGKKGIKAEFELKMLLPSQEFMFWKAHVLPIKMENAWPSGILIQVFDNSPCKSQISELNRENERLRDLALSPSHILRGPLSSMMGLLELINFRQLDTENQKLFGLLKPLMKELDHIIRQHAKKMSALN